jgi:hypothetical protein
VLKENLSESENFQAPSDPTDLTFKGRTFETAAVRAGRSLFKYPLLLCQFLLERLN